MYWRWLVPWILVVAALAQGPRGMGPQPRVPELRAGVPLNIAQIVEVEGAISLGPERVLLENDVELAAGASVRVRAALSSCIDTLVAVELTTADGVTAKLRDEAGRPAWPR